MRIDRGLLKQLAHLQLATPRLATGPRQGSRRSPYRGRGVEFADYRPYSPGDDLRLVDWNVYARLELVLVRLFHEDLNLAVHVCVDASASMTFGEPLKADHAAQLGAAMAVIALLHQDTVSVGCTGGVGPQTVVRGQNENAIPEVIKLLERIEPGGRAEPWRALEAQLHGRRPDRLFLLSDMLCEEADRQRTLRLMAASSASPVLLHVLSPEELDPDLSDPQHITDVESGEELLIRGGRDAARAYREALQQFLNDLQQQCRRYGIHYVPAFTTASVPQLVLGLLRQAGVTESATGETR